MFHSIVAWNAPRVHPEPARVARDLFTQGVSGRGHFIPARVSCIARSASSLRTRPYLGNSRSIITYSVVATTTAKMTACMVLRPLRRTAIAWPSYACAFLGRFTNGSLATFESTRYARGHKALYTFEINGEHASIFWDLHDLHRLQYFDHKDDSVVRGWRSIHVSDGDQPYMKNWWVPGLQIGYEHTFVHQVADFLQGVAKDKWAGPTFRDALETQYVCDAVLSSAKNGRWQKVKHAYK